MSGVIDDITSIFDSGAGSTAGDVASAASDAGSAAASAASDASTLTDAAGSLASDTASAAGDLSSIGNSADSLASATYTVGSATGSWGSSLYNEANDVFNPASANYNFWDTSSINAPVYTNMAVSSAVNGIDSTMANAPMGAPVSSNGLGVVYSNAVPSSSGGGGILGGLFGGGSDSIASLGKYQLIGSLLGAGIQTAGAYLASKPRPPNNFSGRGPGGGPGLTMHATNGGFGLAQGGSTPAPGTPPPALSPQAQGNLAANPSPGAQLSANNSAATPSQPGNIGQTVANQAGVGGIIPQGAINFMRQGAMANG